MRQGMIADSVVCANCGKPLPLTGRSAVHQDGYFRCPAGGFANPVEFVEVAGPEDITAAYEEGYQEGLDEAETNDNEAFTDGKREGAEEERARIIALLEGDLHLDDETKKGLVRVIRRTA